MHCVVRLLGKTVGYFFIYSQKDIECHKPETVVASHYNLGHNTLRLFDVLQNFPFTTCETNRDY